MRRRAGREWVATKYNLLTLCCMTLCTLGVGVSVIAASKQQPPDDWPKLAFGSSEDLLSIFFVALNPKKFHSPSKINGTIINSCKGIVSANSQTYNSFSFLQLSELPGGHYRKQAEIFTNFGHDKINGTMLDCVVKLIEPMCSKSFFMDWKLGYQLLFPAALAVGFCCIAGMICCAVSACKARCQSDNPYAEIGSEALLVSKC